MKDRCCLTGRSPKECTQAREKFLHLEGFRQVIVGAGIDALDALGPDAARGQHEDRKATVIGPPPFEDR